jgi:hypothetical protein
MEEEGRWKMEVGRWKTQNAIIARVSAIFTGWSSEIGGRAW